MWWRKQKLRINNENTLSQKEKTTNKYVSSVLNQKYVLPNLSATNKMWNSHFLAVFQLTHLNSEFSSSYTNCHIKVRELSLLYYLPITGRRIVGFIHFLRVLVLCEIETALSKIWTWVAIANFYDANHYTMNASISEIVWQNLNLMFIRSSHYSL